MGRAKKINGEIHFTRRVSNTNKDTIIIIAYLDYQRRTYTICEPSQESIFFGKSGIDYDLAKAELLKEALNNIKKELKLKSTKKTNK